jgi:hypothetical protein
MCNSKTITHIYIKDVHLELAVNTYKKMDKHKEEVLNEIISLFQAVVNYVSGDSYILMYLM